jgi:branched-chain amino acid aminotransferase
MSLPTSGKIWMDGELIEWADAKVHVLTHTLHYGTGVFEGIRAYETASGAGVFRLTEHMTRLVDSARILMIDVPFTVGQLVDATKEVLRVNELPSAYVRPLVYLGYGEMGLNPLPCPVNVAIAAWPWGTYLGDEGVKNGIKAKISSWRRHDPNAMPPASKGVGMYVNSSLAKVEAVKAGYDEALLLNPQGYVSEGTGENLFVVKNGKVVTTPASDGALNGLTKASVIEILMDAGYEVAEGHILRSDLYTCDEAFVTGTAAEIVPLRSVDDRAIGEPGEITRFVQQTYAAAVRGQVDKYSKWVEHV